MTKRIPQADWRPEGVPHLDPVSDRIVRSDHNLAVLAGPGAGKTETLAQRACYLLQTGLCPSPRRILAVSYKKDSARVIRERVARRCPDGASRFHSVTFDSFAKQLLDRFRQGLPEAFKPTADYEIVFPSRREIQQFLDSLILPQRFEASALRGLAAETFLLDFFSAYQPWLGPDEGSAEAYAAHELFLYYLQLRPSRVTFTMITRLAQAVLIKNPRVLSAVRDAYSHVFLDEFQDTAGAQYDLLATAFRETATVLTAVGDEKQRIMGFAGAMEGAFRRFIADFSTGVERPVINYRAAPNLVRILRILARQVDSDSVDMVAPSATPDGGECALLFFRSATSEADYLAGKISNWILDDGLAPDDICIITKIKPDEYGESLIAALGSHDIRSRYETEATDFLGEEAANDVLRILRLSVRGRSPEDYSYAIELLETLHPSYDDDESLGRKLRTDLGRLCSECKKDLQASGGNHSSVRQILNTVLNVFGEHAYRQAHPAYATGSYLEKLLDKVAARLTQAYLETQNWESAIDETLGKNVITFTSIHKSKGREYHTVIFLGLEDGAFFGFDQNVAENQRAFFVAFSRAMKRVLFTSCASRPTRSTGVKKIESLINMLSEAKVPQEVID